MFECLDAHCNNDDDDDYDYDDDDFIIRYYNVCVHDDMTQLKK